MKTCDVLGNPITVVGWEHALEVISQWAVRRESRFVCICNCHSVVTATTDDEFAKVISAADLVTADGYPVAFLMRRLGHRQQERINGPDLMLRYCRRVAGTTESVYLYGAQQSTLESLREELVKACPGLKIAGTYSPPFRDLTAAEDEAIISEINASGAGVVWVSLGCPKQERWMAAHRGRIKAVMIGVGAAFDYHAGTLKRAPLWMQHHGLEWLYRLMTEPRRLWRRYFVTNSVFILLATKQLWRAYVLSK